jgi:crotonobetainyl-CoA:carnitine CoA-transferase CaiB-like acyl-CoA transferase
MGFDQARLDAINPSLVIGSVNGYGSTGPYVDRPAFDFIGQAMSGFMSINGPSDGEPMRAGPPISDLLAGLYAAFGVVTALVARNNRADGIGQRVEASLNNSLISALAYFSAHYFATGEQPKRTGNDHPIVYPYGLFKARDGDIAVAPSNDIFVERFLQVLGLADLLEQPSYATNKARLDNREQLRDLINGRTEKNEVDHWIDVLNQAGVPAGRVQTLDQVFNDPQVLAQDMVLTCKGDREVKVTGFPVKLSATPARLRYPPPALGEHTETILAALGYVPSQIDTLREAGII